jgi:superfamily II DNA or RNA helicase
MVIKPREEQRNVTTQVFNILQQQPSVLVVAPTGYGKTVVMGDVAAEEIKRGGRVLAIVNLQVLLGQTIATMQHGFQIMSSALHDSIKTYLVGKASHKLVCDYKRNLLVTLPKTLTNTLGLSNDLYFDPSFEPTMIIFDEAHKATSSEFQAIRNRWPNAKVVGFTATPYRDGTDKPGESLAEWYGDRMIVAATMSELIERGDLKKPVYEELSLADDHVGKTWLLATASHENKRTIVFTDDTNHSKQLEAQFLALGIKCEVVTAGKGNVGDVDYVQGQSPVVREDIFKRFHEGITQVLISVNALCEGFDEKLAKFCFLTRKVGSIAFYQQMVGRVLRKCEGERFGYVFDFAGNIKEHGPVEAIEWPRAAKGLLLEREERELSAKSYEKRTNVWKRCEDEDCGHVFNIKTTKICGLCSREHTLQVVSTINIMVRDYLGIDHKKFQEMEPKIKNGLAGNVLFQQLVNKQLDKEIFIDGALNTRYGVIEDILATYEMSKVKKGGVRIGNWEAEVRYAV